MKLLAASIPSAARTLAPAGSNPVRGSSIMADILQEGQRQPATMQRQYHFSRLKVTWDTILTPPHIFCLKKAPIARISQSSTIFLATDGIQEK